MNNELNNLFQNWIIVFTKTIIQTNRSIILFVTISCTCIRNMQQVFNVIVADCLHFVLIYSIFDLSWLVLFCFLRRVLKLLRHSMRVDFVCLYIAFNFLKYVDFDAMYLGKKIKGYEISSYFYLVLFYSDGAGGD